MNESGWDEIKNLYTYNFKNFPYHFQNGGSWPIFNAWLCLALTIHGHSMLVKEIVEEYEKWLDDCSKTRTSIFYEYIHPVTLKPGGVPDLCFSASAYIIMYSTLHGDYKNLKDLLVC